MLTDVIRYHVTVCLHLIIDIEILNPVSTHNSAIHSTVIKIVYYPQKKLESSKRKNISVSIVELHE